MKLSRRLRAICELVPSGSAVVDVGCDHAYVPVELLSSGKCPCAVASDIRSGPLMSARRNIEEAGLADRIRTAVCDGVSADTAALLAAAGLEAGTPVTLVTAGMGGLMMVKILQEAERSLFTWYVASPQKDAAAFRRGLGALGFAIVDEDMIEEEGKFYPILLARRTGERAELTFEEALLGPVLMRKGQEVFRRFLLKRRHTLRDILPSLPEGEGERREELLRELSAVEGLLETQQARPLLRGDKPSAGRQVYGIGGANRADYDQ